MAGVHFGIYRGVVLNANDPSQMGRVQLMVPSLSGQTSGWAMPCLAPGASTSGVKVGDAGWVMFEGGDPTYPVFLGIMPTR